jgi:hypothetical protein
VRCRASSASIRSPHPPSSSTPTAANKEAREDHLPLEHAEDPTSVPVAIEIDKNLIVVALQATGLKIYPINPRAVARYRERYGQSGKRFDPGDAFVVADIQRHDRHTSTARSQRSATKAGR